MKEYRKVCAYLNGHHHTTWNLRQESSPPSRQRVIYFTLTPLEKAWIHLCLTRFYSLIGRKTKFFCFAMLTGLIKGFFWIQTDCIPVENDFVSYLVYCWGVVLNNHKEWFRPSGGLIVLRCNTYVMLKTDQEFLIRSKAFWNLHFLYHYSFSYRRVPRTVYNKNVSAISHI